MKRFLTVLAASLLVVNMNAQKQECSKLFYQYYELFQKDNLKGAYPIWEEVFAKDCKDYEYYTNILTDGEGILDHMIENAPTKEDSVKYGNKYVEIIKRRIELDPKKKLYWESEIAYQKDKAGITTPEQTYQTLSNIYIKAKEFDSELSAGSVTSLYTAAAELNAKEKISFKEFMNTYSNIQKVVKRNSEIRMLKFNDLAAKADSVKLSRDENAKKNELKTFAQYFDGLSGELEGYVSEFMTCSNVGAWYGEDLEANKDSLEWLNTAVYLLDNLGGTGCADADSIYYPKIKDAFVTAYYKAHPDEMPQNNPAETSGQIAVVKKTSTANPDLQKAIAAYSNKNYSSAISGFNKVINTTSGSSKGTYAYYLADSYNKVGSRANAVTWFKKAAQYKPGWAAPYTAIARIFGDKGRINSCGKTNTQKLAAYLVAADYMKKACRYDKSSCKYVGQYERVGPTATDMFNDGFKKGQRVSVTCNGGASTTLR